jgi:hypothetical protein
MESVKYAPACAGNAAADSLWAAVGLLSSGGVSGGSGGSGAIPVIGGVGGDNILVGSTLVGSPSGNSSPEGAYKAPKPVETMLLPGHWPPRVFSLLPSPPHNTPAKEKEWAETSKALDDVKKQLVEINKKMADPNAMQEGFSELLKSQLELGEKRRQLEEKLDELKSSGAKPPHSPMTT